MKKGCHKQPVCKRRNNRASLPNLLSGVSQQRANQDVITAVSEQGHQDPGVSKSATLSFICKSERAHVWARVWEITSTFDLSDKITKGWRKIDRNNEDSGGTQYQRPTWALGACQIQPSKYALSRQRVAPSIEWLLRTLNVLDSVPNTTWSHTCHSCPGKTKEGEN